MCFVTNLFSFIINIVLKHEPCAPVFMFWLFYSLTLSSRHCQLLVFVNNINLEYIYHFLQWKYFIMAPLSYILFVSISVCLFVFRPLSTDFSHITAIDPPYQLSWITNFSASDRLLIPHDCRISGETNGYYTQCSRSIVTEK